MDVELGSLNSPNNNNNNNNNARPKAPEHKAHKSFGRQFNALFRKSATYRKRQYKTNCCQILFPLLLIILLFVLQTVVNGFINNRSDTSIPGSPHPVTLPPFLFKPILRDESCSLSPPAPIEVDVLYADRTSITSDLDVQSLLGNTSADGMLVFGSQGDFNSICYVAPKFIYPLEFKDQSSKANLDNALFNEWKWNSTLGAYIFNGLSESPPALDFTVSYNKTFTLGNDLPALINLITRSFVRMLTGKDMYFAGVRDFPRTDTKVSFDLVSIIGPYLYLYIFQMIFPVMLETIVYEKEGKLREIMKMMGLNMGVYWLVTYIFNYLMFFIMIILTWILASLLRFRYWTLNAHGAIFGLIFIWGHVLVAASFFFSTLFGKTRTAVVMGYVYVFASGLLANQVMTSFLQNPDTPNSVVFGISVIPTFALYRALLLLSNSVQLNGGGIQPKDIAKSGLDVVFVFLVIEWVVLMVLSIYLENVLPSGYGVKRHPLFFLQKSFWFKSPQNRQTVLVRSNVEGEPNDVAEERAKLLGGGNFALEILDLHKVYAGVGGQPDKIAVKSLAMGIEQGQCFGFLGPNGAGKSTTIGCISGLFPPSSGTAKIYGYDIRTEISHVHSLMGVCAQDNILWGDLTGREHMMFYARLKGMSGKALEEAIEEGLKAVNLWGDRHKRSGSYSGGMKRRLSVAIALVGNPQLVLLDEPSTGLDPASRRQLWDIINVYKKKCSMLLTTHAMEEADALCDRLCIFDQGQLKCIGTAAELKSRYGKGLKVMISTDPAREAEAHKFLLSLAPQSVLLNSIAGTRNYEVPKEGVSLGALFQAFEGNKERLGIHDWGVSLTTLEEVFMKVTMGEGSTYSYDPSIFNGAAGGEDSPLQKSHSLESVL
eukprot:TRINITY_DN3645_c1_g1_i2.p1 TRINITY_DN3645_c1_g1~~TRINITY_DN3645_c1_g1_i2.p1  ORF type:complete len:881 (-),score=186.76 TRINITY_DN3645_c1_g1_i2:11-2653(-)